VRVAYILCWVLLGNRRSFLASALLALLALVPSLPKKLADLAGAKGEMWSLTPKGFQPLRLWLEMLFDVSFLA